MKKLILVIAIVFSCPSVVYSTDGAACAAPRKLMVALELIGATGCASAAAYSLNKLARELLGDKFCIGARNEEKKTCLSSLSYGNLAFWSTTALAAGVATCKIIKIVRSDLSSLKSK